MPKFPGPATTAPALLVSMLITGTGCDGSSPTDFTSPNLQVVRTQGLHFITQSAIPLVSMEALFTGRLIIDDADCMRLGSADGATVVWPQGYTGQRTLDGFFIHRRDGTIVGRVGGQLSLAGGEIEELLAALGFSEEDRELAARFCPGRYWLAGP